MRRPFCRVGSKAPIAKAIVKLIPDHKTYVEPFVGGGAVFWEKEPSEHEVINDLDSRLISAWRLLKRVKGRNFKNLEGEEAIKRFYKSVPHTDEDKLAYEIIHHCGGFGSIPVKNGKIYKFSNPLSKLKHIEEYQERLKHVKILNQSYESVVKKYDSPSTFFYLDPPYENSDRLYKNDAVDYDKMADLLSKLKGKFLLSINDSAHIRQVFSQFHIKKIRVSGGSNGNSDIGKRDRGEILVSN